MRKATKNRSHNNRSTNRYTNLGREYSYVRATVSYAPFGQGFALTSLFNVLQAVIVVAVMKET